MCVVTTSVLNSGLLNCYSRVKSGMWSGVVWFFGLCISWFGVYSVSEMVYSLTVLYFIFRQSNLFVRILCLSTGSK